MFDVEAIGIRLVIAFGCGRACVSSCFAIALVGIFNCRVPNCGESYLTAETLHEIERIKLHRRSLAKPRNVAVASFV